MALIRNTSCQIPEEKPALTLLSGVDGCLGWPFSPRKTQQERGGDTLPRLTSLPHGQPGPQQSCTQLRCWGGWGEGHTISSAHNVTQLPPDTLTPWCHCGLGKSYLLPKQEKEKTERTIPGQCHFGGNHSEGCLNSRQQTGTALIVASESHS